VPRNGPGAPGRPRARHRRASPSRALRNAGIRDSNQALNSLAQKPTAEPARRGDDVP
jgi:hypothetical protein